MVSLKIMNKNLEIKNPEEIGEYLGKIGIQYERWNWEKLSSEDASQEEILEAYAREIGKLKEQGGYVTADVIDINKKTENLGAMLEKFNREHWHDEDEVRYTLKGHGLFHIRTEDGDILVIEVERGDLLRVPRGTKHWFNLCSDMEIRAIRLFQQKSGWTPYYTGSRADEKFQPLCFGPSFIKNAVSRD